MTSSEFLRVLWASALGGFTVALVWAAGRFLDFNLLQNYHWSVVYWIPLSCGALLAGMAVSARIVPERAYQPALVLALGSWVVGGPQWSDGMWAWLNLLALVGAALLGLGLCLANDHRLPTAAGVCLLVALTVVYSWPFFEGHRVNDPLSAAHHILKAVADIESVDPNPMDEFLALRGYGETWVAQMVAETGAPAPTSSLASPEEGARRLRLSRLEGMLELLLVGCAALFFSILTAPNPPPPGWRWTSMAPVLVGVFLAEQVVRVAALWFWDRPVAYSLLTFGSALPALAALLKYAESPRALFRWAGWRLVLVLLGLHTAGTWLVTALNLQWSWQDWAYLLFLGLGPVEIGVELFRVLVWAPIFEEMIYRGLLFGGLREHLGPMRAAVASSFLFALVHYYSPVGFLCVFWTGLILCLAFHKSGSLVPGILVHAGINCLAVLCAAVYW